MILVVYSEKLLSGRQSLITLGQKLMTGMKFLRIRDLQEKVGLSRSQIYKLIQGEEFPRQLKIGSRISVWKESDVDKWMSEMDPIEHLTD